MSTSALTLSYHHAPRRVRVVVPPAMETAPPVLVLFDGQNVLDDHGSYAGGWHAQTAVRKLPKTVRRPVIVAVDHGGAGRMRELWHDVDAFLHFVVAHALPAAEAHLGRRFDPAARAIGGASLGGLATLLALARHPHVFRAAIAMSPSVWVAPRAILSELRHARLAHESRVYVDVGLRESPAMIRCARAASDVIAAHLPADRRMWRPDRRGRHREADWRRRMPKALRFTFHR